MQFIRRRPRHVPTTVYITPMVYRHDAASWSARVNTSGCGRRRPQPFVLYPADHLLHHLTTNWYMGMYFLWVRPLWSLPLTAIMALQLSQLSGSVVLSASSTRHSTHYLTPEKIHFDVRATSNLFLPPSLPPSPSLPSLYMYVLTCTTRTCTSALQGKSIQATPTSCYVSQAAPTSSSPFPGPFLSRCQLFHHAPPPPGARNLPPLSPPPQPP